ncbi:HD-GYP domain-containing protein [Blastomonas aquatica]|uniref:Cyclic di-GMP phosphodiesterase n=1 Tax=Blastomonas aquatica TaxID=1510276 RepID=A0ABQ1JRF2_9SPHN|nr:HD-GYP domain-containing protein [Blastomonas aquatica]GGB73702.1 cyclic di-GMP phosphodiesterase [Blastomonas aquatica]
MKHIKPAEVKAGMFIHGFVGSWFDHPFWRKKFLLVDQGDVLKIRASNVSAVIIDSERGAAPAEPEPPTVATTPDYQRKAVLVTSRYASSRPLPRKTSFRQETRRAVRIVEKSKQQVGAMFESARLGQAVKLPEVLPLIDEIRESVERNSKALISLVQLKTKDEYTYMHSLAVCTLMINFARKLDLDDETIRSMGVAGLLHDLGKMAVPQMILDKTERLTADEMTTIRSHPERGHALIGNNRDIPDIARDVCLHHHEKMDGSGYPFGLKGSEISMAARMGAICDVYDAVTSNRPYKDPWTPCTALGRMMQWEGHFDERLMQVFINSLGLYPAGGLVRLNDHRLALVVDNCAQDPAGVRVLPFYCTSRLQELTPEEITVVPDRGVQILGTERPEFWHFEEWSRMRNTILSKAAPLSAAA